MKNNFIKSTIILIIGGLISKILGMIIKIVLTRTIGTEGISQYMLILPTFNLFISLCNLGVPTAITKYVSEKKIKTKKLIIPTTIIILIYNLFLILIIYLITPYLSSNLLKNDSTYYPLLAISLTLPFISISSILKGYFFGVEKVFPVTLSNIVEQLIRLLLTIFVISKLMHYSMTLAITFVVLINILSEGASIIILLLFTPNKTLHKEDFKKDKQLLNQIFSLSIPTTFSRLIGSIVYFLEPIILYAVLEKYGYSSSYIKLEYGIINGYTYPIVLLPSFFTLAISSAILPVVSSNYSRNNKKEVKRKIRQAIIYSLLIGVPFTILIMISPELPLKLIYNTALGDNYLKVIAPFFILHYIQSPLTSSLNGMGYTKTAMKGTIYGGIIKILSLIVLSTLKIGLWSLIISTILNIIIVTTHHLYYINKYLK